MQITTPKWSVHVRLHGTVVEISYANAYDAQVRSWAQGQPGISIYIKFPASLGINNQNRLSVGSKVFLNTNEMT